MFEVGDKVRIEMYNCPALTGVIRSKPIAENPKSRAVGLWFYVECPEYVDDDNRFGLIHASRLSRLANEDRE